MVGMIRTVMESKYNIVIQREFSYKVWLKPEVIILIFRANKSAVSHFIDISR